LLKEKVDLLIRRIFGTKSEKLEAAQLELLLSGLEVGKALASEGQPTPEAEAIIQVVKAAAKGAAQRARRERWPTDLPVEQQFIDPEEVRANPDAYRYIGQEVNERKRQTNFITRSLAANSLLPQLAGSG